MCYAIEAAMDATLLDDIAVSTDDQEILDIAGQYDDIIPIKRPKSISGDRSLAIEYVQHVLLTLNKTYDAVAIIQPSSPFTLGEDIDGTIQLMYQEKAESAASIVKLDHVIHPSKLKLLDGYHLKPYLQSENDRMAEHELPDLYVRNGSVYVARPSILRESHKLIGSLCAGYLMPRERSLDINDVLDFRFAEFMCTRNG